MPPCHCQQPCQPGVLTYNLGVRLFNTPPGLGCPAGWVTMTPTKQLLTWCDMTAANRLCRTNMQRTGIAVLDPTYHRATSKTNTTLLLNTRQPCNNRRRRPLSSWEPPLNQTICTCTALYTQHNTSECMCVQYCQDCIDVRRPSPAGCAPLQSPPPQHCNLNR